MSEEHAADTPLHAVTVTAEGADALKRALSDAIKSPFSYACRGRAAKFRRAAVASDEDEAEAILRAPRENGRTLRKLAFAFPGQGAAGAVPAAMLCRVMPIFSKYLQIAEEAAERTSGTSLAQALDGGRTRSALAEHISVFVYSAALAFQYIDWGFVPDMLLPYSLGEFAAAAVSGMTDFRETVSFICRRAALIDAIKEPGVMLHAEAPLELAEELAARSGGALSVAAVNWRSSIVLSGSTKAAETAERSLDIAKIPHRRLRVPYAAHSQIAAAAAEKIAAIPFPAQNEPRFPIFSTLDGKQLSAEEYSRPQRRAEQCLNPVRFDKVLAAAEDFARGADITAVEIGAHRTLAGAGIAALPKSRWLGASSMKNYVGGKSREYCFRRGIMETAAALWEEGFADGLEWTKV